MNDDYRKGFVTGMAMNPLFVTTETAPPATVSGLTIMTDICETGAPLYILAPAIIAPTNTED